MIKDRIDELRALKDGWTFPEESERQKALSAEGLDWLEEKLNWLGSLCPEPTMITPDCLGHIWLIWKLEEMTVRLEVNLKSHAGTWSSWVRPRQYSDSRARS